MSVGDGLCHFGCCDGTAFLAVLVDKADDGLATLFHLLLVVSVKLEGDGVAFELLLFVHIAVCLG